MVTQEKNRLGITPTALKGDIEAHLEFLEGQITAVKKRLHEHIQAQTTLKDQHHFAHHHYWSR